jgi:hypothetical protein
VRKGLYFPGGGLMGKGERGREERERLKTKD